MQYRHSCTLIFCIIFTVNVFGQFGDKSAGHYIVHNIGDTLFGKLTLERSHISVSYKNDEQKEITRKFPYGDIKLYKNQSNIINRRFPTALKGRPLQILETGKINYYYHKLEGWVQTPIINGAGGGSYYREIDQYYIEKGDIFFRINRDLFKKQLKKVFNDDKISMGRLKQKGLKWEHAQMLVEDYNKRN